MNLSNLLLWVAIVLAFAATNQIDNLQRWVWRAQAKVINESRTATWGAEKVLVEDQQSLKGIPACATS